MTRSMMPNPVLIGKNYYLRVNVPSDVAKAANGMTVIVPIEDAFARAVVGTHVKVSLRTKDPREAKQRHTHAHDALLKQWDALRSGPQKLNHKQCVALAGQVRADFISITDENPGSPVLWARIVQHDIEAKKPTLHPFAALIVGPKPEPSNVAGMEERWGAFTDVVLGKHYLVVDEGTRWKLLLQVAKAMQEVAPVNLKKASGDYSDTGETDRYPTYQPEGHERPATAPRTPRLTFDMAIDEEARQRAAGKDGVALRENTIKKYQRGCREFAAHRGSTDLPTVTAKEVDSWKHAMLQEAVLSNNTIGQRLVNMKTVLEWADDHSLGELFPKGNPAQSVRSPKKAPKDSSEMTLRIDEAVAVLKASRLETKPELRWAPWLMAYSGARVEEIAQLAREDFFPMEGQWFYRLTTRGLRTLKTDNGIRRVPIHPDIMEEGFMDFVKGVGPPDTTRLFPKRTQAYLRSWIRGRVGITRAALKPNHGWRHLFEDKAMGMPDGAKNYITGRTTGKSEEGYGKSDAMLPPLAAEMSKISSYLSE